MVASALSAILLLKNFPLCKNIILNYDISSIKLLPAVATAKSAVIRQCKRTTWCLSFTKRSFGYNWFAWYSFSAFMICWTSNGVRRCVNISRGLRGLSIFLSIYPNLTAWIPQFDCCEHMRMSHIPFSYFVNRHCSLTEFTSSCWLKTLFWSGMQTSCLSKDFIFVLKQAISCNITIMWVLDIMVIFRT